MIEDVNIEDENLGTHQSYKQEKGKKSGNNQTLDPKDKRFDSSRLLKKKTFKK